MLTGQQAEPLDIVPASPHILPVPPHILPTSPHIMMVCRTCPRFADGKTWPGTTQGEELAQRIAALWQEWASAARFRLRVLTCLGGCPNPCNVALSGPAKWRLRIRHMVPDDAALLLAAATAYLAHPDGNLGHQELPAALRGRISARTPPYATPIASDPGTQRQASA